MLTSQSERMVVVLFGRFDLRFLLSDTVDPTRPGLAIFFSVLGPGDTGRLAVAVDEMEVEVEEGGGEGSDATTDRSNGELTVLVRQRDDCG